MQQRPRGRAVHPVAAPRDVTPFFTSTGGP